MRRWQPPEAIMDKLFWKRYPADGIVILAIYSIGFLVGTCTHVLGLVLHGFLAYDAPLLMNVYWDLLTLLDPLAILLLWVRIKFGLALAIIIMVTDISINSYAYVQGVFGEPALGMIPMSLFLQSMFGLFVLATAPVLVNRLE